MCPEIDISTIASLSDLTSEIHKPENTIVNSTSGPALTPQEHEIFRIWTQILGYADFGVDDDLFRIGGDSIAAVQIFSAVNEKFGINLSMQDLFSTSHFSIKWLSDLISRNQIGAIGEEEYSALLQHVEGLSEDEVDRLLKRELSKLP